MHNITVKEVIEALKKCVDPEIGLDIVDLGLIQGIRIDEKNNVNVKLTMTSPMCPVTSVILADIQLRIEHMPDAGSAEIDLVWEPAWTPEMISEEARMNMQV